MHSAQGIILKIEDFRERDCRVILFTREFGKISVVAKGVKRIEAKLRGNLDVFNFADIIFVEGSYFFILTGVDARERFTNIIKHPAVYRAAIAIADLLDRIYDQNMGRYGKSADSGFFTMVLEVLRKLDEFGQGSMRASQKELYSWLLLKKLQAVILENQGYTLEKASGISASAKGLFAMLTCGTKRSVRLRRQDFLDVEGLFLRQFAYLFNFRPLSWVPNFYNSPPETPPLH